VYQLRKRVKKKSRGKKIQCKSGDKNNTSENQTNQLEAVRGDEPNKAVQTAVQIGKEKNLRYKTEGATARPVQSGVNGGLYAQIVIQTGNNGLGKKRTEKETCSVPKHSPRTKGCDNNLKKNISTAGNVRLLSQIKGA